MWLFCLLDPFIPTQIKFLATSLITSMVCDDVACLQSDVPDAARQFSRSFRLAVSLHGGSGRRPGRLPALPLRLPPVVVGGGRQVRPGGAVSSLRPPGLTVHRPLRRRDGQRAADRLVRETQADQQHDGQWRTRQS